MGLQMKKKDDLDSLFAELGVLEMPEGIVVPDSETMILSQSEDPFAKWLPKSETLKSEES